MKKIMLLLSRNEKDNVIVIKKWEKW
jgi:hypothetical protein